MRRLQNFLDIFFPKKTVVVIVGPTASGKSTLAIQLAQNHNGEVISCDSRQIYKDLEIFSGAVTPETSEGVKHHLVSCLPIGTAYSAEEFVRDSLPVVDDLLQAGKLPIIAGGTGFWAQALMYDSPFPKVSPDQEFRETLLDVSTKDLFARLQEQDPRRADQMDPHNRKRLVRALEIINKLGTVPRLRETLRSGYRFVLVYLQPEKSVLDERITKNVSQRVREGLFAEAKTVTQTLDRQACEELGLGYKYIYDVLEGDLGETEFVSQMVVEEVRYAKRQKTFLKKLFAKHTGPKVMITSLDHAERMKRVTSLL